MNDSARRAVKPRRLVGSLAVSLFSSVLLLAACEGDNLFSGGPSARGSSGPPVVDTITAPVTVAEGGRLDVRVRAVAPAGMSKIDVQFRRAVNDDQSVTFDGTRTDTVTADVSLNVPATVQDSIIEVRAFATDKNGRTSEIVVRTVRVESRTLPTVTVSVTPTGSVSLGDTLRVRVSARDNFGLAALGYVIVTQNGDTVRGPTFAAVSGVLRDTTFLVALPSGLSAGAVSVHGLAVNNQQLRGVSSPLALELVDRRGPIVDIVSPLEEDAYPLSDSILVRVHVVDSGGIAELRLKGVAIRQDQLNNTTVVDRYVERTIPFPQAPSSTFPLDTTLQRFLRPAADTTSEPVYIIATARDRAGNVSADTVRIIDGPRVVILGPPAGAVVGVNNIMLVQLSATDRLAGLDSVKLIVGGVQQQTHVIRNLAPRTALDTTIAVATGPVTGTLTLTPGVWNRRGIGGLSHPITVSVSQTAVSDTALPRVLRIVQSTDRVELDDSLRVTVRATDGFGSGIRRMGVVVVVVPENNVLPTRTLVRTSDVFSPALTGTPERVFDIPLSEAYSVLETPLPLRFTLQVHAFAEDAANNCGASVQPTLMAAACNAIDVNGVRYYSAAGVAASSFQVTAVAGESVTLPGGGKIADAVVDPVRRRVYLSNIGNNRVDIFNLGADTFDITGSRQGACGPAPTGVSSCRGVVGAAPWGLFINARGDSLIVANSGGTNISFLALDGPDYMREHVARRVLTPNVVLWELTQSLTETGLRYTTKWYDFSDRPQFVAQHASGFLLYSTLPTPSARDGTIRVADMDPDPVATDDLPESRILLTNNSFTDAADTWAIADLDSLRIVRGTGADSVILYDHLPGFYSQPGRPGQLIVSDVLPFPEAVTQLVGLGSDVSVTAGGWNISGFALADTTFIAASTDRNRIAIGEGARAPTGRIFMCCEVTTNPLRVGISGGIEVVDLLNNAAERVSGVGLNFDGSLGVARGAQGAYYFTPDLRLQGEFRSGVAGGAGGAAMHPDHASALETGDRALSFVATPNRSIKIIDATHFYQRGEIAVRDNVVGPVRAVLPDPSENAGLSSSNPNYIVVKLIAVTAGDNVVIVDVRRKDVGF